jgi:predicted dehydrogenase
VFDSKGGLSIVCILGLVRSHTLLAIEAISHQANVPLEKGFVVTTEQAATILDSSSGSGVKHTAKHN